MNILAFDFSTKILSISLKKDDSYYNYSAFVGFQHSENLLSSIEFLLYSAGIKGKDLDLVVCPLGPGSFTGLRIGMATAKGMADGAKCPFKAVPTLDGWAGFDFVTTTSPWVDEATEQRVRRFAFFNQLGWMNVTIQVGATDADAD